MGEIIWYVSFDSIKVLKKQIISILLDPLSHKLLFKAKFTWERRSVIKHSYL